MRTITKTFQFLTSSKNKLHFLQTQDVYSISYSSGKIYIVETVRSISTRSKYISGISQSQIASSALPDRSRDYCHFILLDKTSIISKWARKLARVGNIQTFGSSY